MRKTLVTSDDPEISNAHTIMLPCCHCANICRYSPEQLYAVVSSVQDYHQFVPWCVGSNIITRSDDGSYLEAELAIGFQMISER